MNSVPRDRLTRLLPEVRQFATARFVLEDDLNHLAIVLHAGAPEAVILYCARVLDALADDALRRLGQTPASNVFSNLQVLEHFDRLDTAVRYWAHALRRLGNMVRHIERRVGPEEATLSALFTEGWLEWYFCRFSHGYRLTNLTLDQKPLGLGGGDELRVLMQALEELAVSGHAPRAGVVQYDLLDHPSFSTTPVLCAVSGEILLARSQFEQARGVLTAGLTRFPDDLRLRQLIGLSWSRSGDLDRAIEWLEPLQARSFNDEETAGILAGVYKRRWISDRTNLADLEKSHRIYKKAWKTSGKKNTYLGINSATTALWLGCREGAGRLAVEVENALRQRSAALPRSLDDPQLDFRYWDQVTLGEAQLLQGNWAAAQETYRVAFIQHAQRQGDIAVSRQQRDEIIQYLGLPEIVDGDPQTGGPPGPARHADDHE